MDSLEILPRVSIYGGNVVLTTGDGYKRMSVDPLSLIERASKSYSTVLLEDIDAIVGRMPHLDLLRKIEKLDVWVDGGIRSSENVMDILVAGGSKAVIGTKTLKDFRELEKALKLTQNIVFQIDYCHRVVGRVAMQSRNAAKLVERAKDAGIETFLFIDNHCSLSPLDEVGDLSFGKMLEELYVGIVSEKQIEQANNLALKGVVIEALELVADE